MKRYLIAVMIIISVLTAQSTYCQAKSVDQNEEQLQDKDLAMFMKGEQQKVAQDEERVAEDDNAAAEKKLMEQKAKDRAARIEGNGTWL